MKLYSYVVARDFGFAPNPFHGFCTLATCKPVVRRLANIDDWVIGIGSKKPEYNLSGHLVYAMQVSEVMDFDSYWSDPRFLRKRPDMNGSLKMVYGDNIYHHDGKQWVQADSHHSFVNGLMNEANVEHDTSANRVLVATKFVYWGKSAPEIPDRFRPFGETNEDICRIAQGHLVFGDELADAFATWLDQQGHWGYQDEPLEFAHHSTQEELWA